VPSILLHFLEVNDSSAEDVEAALRVEGLQVVIERDLDASDASPLQVGNGACHKASAQTRLLAFGMNHEVEKKSVRDPVTEHRHVPDKSAVAPARRVVCVVLAQDAFVRAFSAVPSNHDTEILDLSGINDSVSDYLRFHLPMPMVSKDAGSVRRPQLMVSQNPF